MLNVNEIKSKILYEKYRPQTLKDIILPAKIKTSMTKYISEGEIPCLLFYSASPGVGKTSLAHILCNEIGADYLYINTSLDNGIDVLRSRIDKFATCMSMTGKPKIVILDELGSNNNRALQEGLKAAIENFTDSCRFIITSNSFNKILPYIRSRCTLFDFDFKDGTIKSEMIKKIWKRFDKILTAEQIECDPKLLLQIIEKHYPDMRYLFNLIQDFTDQNGKLITNEILKFSMIDDTLIDLILNKKFTKARELVIQSSYNYSDLYRFFYDKLIPRMPDKAVGANAIMIISEFMWRESQGVMDSEINFAHCILNIMQLL